MTTKKTLLAGMAAIALGLAMTGNAWATSDWNLDQSKEANDNSGAVAQEESKATALNGNGANANDKSSSESLTGDGTTAQGPDSSAADGAGNFNQGGGNSLQAGADGNAVSAENGAISAVQNSTSYGAEDDSAIADGAGSLAFSSEDTEALAFGENSVAVEDGAIGGNDSAVAGESNEGAVATGGSIAVVSSGSAGAFNQSAAVEEGGLLVGDGLAVGHNNNGAIADGEGSVAASRMEDSFNFMDEMKAESIASLEQKTAETSMYATGGTNTFLGGGADGGELTTGGIANGDVTGNLGVTTANLNTGLVNQGASVGVAAVASAN